MFNPKVLLTNKCNRACEFCFQTSLSDKNSEITCSDFTLLLLWLKKQSIETLTILGGEPSVHREFKQLLSLTNENGFNINILSNLLFQNEICSCFNNVKNICANITMFNQYTPNEQFLIRKNLATLECLKIDVLLSVTLYKTDQNIEHIFEFAQKHKNINSIRIDLSRPSVDKRNRFISAKNINSYKSQLLLNIKKIEEHGLNAIFDCPFPKCFFTPEEIECYDLLSKGLSYNECGNLIINPNLSIGSCPIYNFKKSKITDFESYSEVKNLIMNDTYIDELKYSLSTYEMCDNCQSRLDKSCTGYCIAEKVMLN